MTLRNYIYKTKKIRFTHIFAVASKASALQWCKLANSIEDHYIAPFCLHLLPIIFVI